MTVVGSCPVIGGFRAPRRLVRSKNEVKLESVGQKHAKSGANAIAQSWQERTVCFRVPRKGMRRPHIDRGHEVRAPTRLRTLGRRRQDERGEHSGVSGLQVLRLNFYLAAGGSQDVGMRAVVEGRGCFIGRDT